jgi:DNA-binding MarR family transcriptional regulator
MKQRAASSDDKARDEGAQGAGAAPFDIETFTPYLLNRLVNLINVGYRKDLGRRGLTLNHWRVLAALQHHEPQLVTELARVTVTDRTTLSRLLTVMVERGLLRRDPRANDARYIDVSLTPAGRALFEELRPVALGKADEVLRGLTAEETRRLRALILKAIAPFEEDQAG